MGISAAGRKVAAIGRIFDIPRRTVYDVSSPGRPYRANPEGVKNVPLSISILILSSEDMTSQMLPSWRCGTFPVTANCHWSRSRANMTAWGISTRSSTLRLCTPWQPPVAGQAMFMHDGAMHAAHCEYQGPAAARTRWSFVLAKQGFWFECDRKFVVLHQTIIKQCQQYRPWCVEFTLWGSPDVNDIPRASTRHIIHCCRRHVRNLLDAPGDLIGYWRFILQL